MSEVTALQTKPPLKFCCLHSKLLFRQGIWTRGLHAIKNNTYRKALISRTRFGHFLKVLGNKISNKRSPNYWKLLGLFWKISLFCINCNGYFLGNFFQHLVTLALILFDKIWNTGNYLRYLHSKSFPIGDLKPRTSIHADQHDRTRYQEPASSSYFIFNWAMN